MEREVEPLIEFAGGDIEMGVFAEEAALTSIEALAALAAVPVAIAETPIVMMAAGTAALLGLGEHFLGKRKRSPTGVIVPSAGGTSRAPPPKRPRIPGPSGEMPARKKVSKKMKGRKGPKAKTQKSKRPVKKKTSSKKKPKKKSPSYTVSIKQEVHGKFRRKNVSYFGFQATAGMHELFRVAADAIMRAFLKRHHVSIRRTDLQVPISSSVPAMSQMSLSYRRAKYDDGTDGGGVDGPKINFASGTYESHVTTLADELQTNCRLGYYPRNGYTYNSSNAIIVNNPKVGDAKLVLSVKRMIKLRNVTKNDDNGDTMTSLDTNPIQGRLYKFRHDTPRVAPVMYETDIADFSKFHDRNCTAGVIFGPQRAAADDHDGPPATPTMMSEDRVLSSPPPGGRVWDNLSSSKKIAMAPGQAALHKMSFKYAGTVRQFLAKFATSAYDAPTIGYCHMFGFEQKFKTDENDEINIEYDCDDVLKSSCVFVREDMTPPTVITHHAHSSAYV